jgi:hypothetical protein
MNEPLNGQIVAGIGQWEAIILATVILTTLSLLRRLWRMLAEG